MGESGDALIRPVILLVVHVRLACGGGTVHDVDIFLSVRNNNLNHRLFLVALVALCKAFYTRLPVSFGFT